MAAARTLLRAAGAATPLEGRLSSLLAQVIWPWISLNCTNATRRMSTNAALTAAASDGVEREERVRRALFNGTAKCRHRFLLSVCVLNESR